MATLREYFDTDFTRVLNAADTFRLQNQDSTVEVRTRVHFDFDSNSKYLSCFLPECENPAGVIAGLLNSLDMLLALGDSVEVQSGLPGEKPMSSKTLRFSGRFFIYSERPVQEADLDILIKQAEANAVLLQYRGHEYAAKRSSLEKPLAFISHDTRDKDAVARPVAIGLITLMCPVWFDEFTLKVGDRLRESIEKGIRECQKCILVLSPNFLSNPGWTKTEFNSIFTRELIEGTDFLLPIWYGVTKKQVFDYSPTLADRVGVNWDLGEKEVVRRLYRAINAKKSA
jgi:TIR domain-containing protein